jgi:hypothetical protein
MMEESSDESAEIITKEEADLARYATNVPFFK